MAGEGFYRVTVVQSMYNQQINNVLNFHGPTADAGALSTLANEVDTIWVERIRQRQTASVTYSGIRVHALGTALPVFVKTINKAGIPGADTELDPVQAFVLRLRTAHFGKHGRGRVYIAGVLKGWTSNGLVTAAQITAWNSTIDLILGNTGFGSSPYFPSIMDKAATASFAITSMQIAPTLGHQRRRNIGIGV
jgi:hypothetical protein